MHRLLNTLPQKYKCHAGQQIDFFMLVRCILIAVRTKTSIV